MEKNYSRLKDSFPAPFIDSEGYKKFVAEKEQASKVELEKQKSAIPK